MATPASCLRANSEEIDHATHPSTNLPTNLAQVQLLFLSPSPFNVSSSVLSPGSYLLLRPTTLPMLHPRETLSEGNDDSVLYAARLRDHLRNRP